MATTYDPSKVVIIFAGGIITGYADGVFIKAGRNVDTWTIVVGADGTVTRVRSVNRSGRVTLTLMGGSPSNDHLSAVATIDELAGTGLGPFLMKDNNGTELVIGANGWVVKPADTEKGKDLANREWIIEIDEMYLEGGALIG